MGSENGRHEHGAKLRDASMTEARRKASQAYKERQASNGVRVVSVRLGLFDRCHLKFLAEKHGVSQSKMISLLLQNCETA